MNDNNRMPPDGGKWKNDIKGAYMRKLIVLIIAAALLSGGAISGCAKRGTDGGGAAGAPQGGGGQRGGRGKKGMMKIAAAGYRPLVLKREYVGEVSAAYTVEIRSTGSGWLKSMLVDIGQKVQKGQVLCTVDQEDMRAQTEQAQAQGRQAEAAGRQAKAQGQKARADIAAADAAVARAEADLQQAVSDEARSEAMFEKGFISKSALENAKTTVKKYEAALGAARAQRGQADAALEQAKAQMSQSAAQYSQSAALLKSARVRLEYLTIRAPFSGVVAEKYVDAGAYVSPSVSIVKIVDDTAVKVVVNAVEEDITRIRAGSPAGIVSDAWPGRVFGGKVVRVSPVVEAGSGTGAVEVLVQNGDGALRPGMMVRATLVAARVPRALAVPDDAVLTDQVSGGRYVAVMARGGKPEKREVLTGVEAEGFVEIIKGLTEGDKVILGGLPAGEGAGGPGGGRGGGGGRPGGKGEGR